MPNMTPSHLSIVRLFPHMQLTEATHCPHNQLCHCRQTYAHTFTLHTSTFSSSWICVCSTKHPPGDNIPFTSLAPLSTMTQALSLNIEPDKTGHTQEFLGTRFCQQTWEALPEYQKCPRHKHMLFHPQIARSSSQTPHLWPHMLQLLTAERKEASR